jgi:DNA-binding transcriptional regulator YiaG
VSSSDITDDANLESTWTKTKIKAVRLRLGWSQADLARRLHCASTEIVSWECGAQIPSTYFLNELFIIAKYADACSHEVHRSPRAESLCDQNALGQIQFSEIKEEIE